MQKKYGIGEDRVDYINDDMLKFVSKLPDKSTNFLINGIDDSIIRNNKYWEKLSKELYRATEDSGIITGYGSAFYHFEKYFRDITPKVIVIEDFKILKKKDRLDVDKI